MSAESFLDSNIILYNYMNTEVAKKNLSERLIKRAEHVISAQVIGEVCNNLRKKLQYTPDELEGVIEELYVSFNIISVDKNVYMRVPGLLRKYAVSFWDSLIIAAALDSGCTTLYSEDMQNGLKIDFLTIVNPFNSEQKV
ncbi:MAG: PIN domain-containing protein [Planctomycetes bacterium]|nr:PIN domain-containing protein [Planctomycetota bacterium]